MNSTRFAALAAAAALLTAAGCAAGSSGNGSGDGGGSSSDSGGDGGSSELRVAIPAYPGSWDQDFVAFDQVALTMFKNVYPYLIDYGIAEVDGGEILDTQNILPSWAESFESEDGMTWTLTLREGATFPSGNPITAEDVKWSKDRAFAAQANVAGVYALIGLTEPDQVQVVDERTVVFEQTHPSALTEQIQAISLFVYDSQLMQEHATPDDPWAQEWAAQNPSDGGYYVVSDFTPGQEIVLTANEDYPGEHAPQIETIRFTVASDTAAAGVLLREGDVDVAMGLSRQQVADLEGADGVRILSAPGNEMVYLPLNTAMAPFDDVLVRQAVAQAIPYDEIISTVYGGEARRPYSLVPIDMPGYTEDGFPYEQDLDQARALMAQAGVGDVQVELAYQSDSAEHEQIAVLVQNALAEIGITVVPTPLDPATLGDRRAAKDLPIQIASGQHWVDDVEYLANNTLKTDAYLNYAAYSSPAVDAVLETAATLTDAAQREALWVELQGRLATDVPGIPLAQPDFTLPVQEDVGGFVQPVDGLIRFNTFTFDE